MYKSTFEEAFLGVSPKTADEEFARGILSAEKPKSRTTHRKAVILPIAAAIAAIGTVTASAAGGLDLFEAFRSYFSRQNTQIAAETEAATYADLSAAGMTAYDKVFDAGDYTVRVNGLIADARYVYLSYDVDYKNEKYFENGKVGAKYTENSPVNFLAEDNESGFFYTTGWGEAVGVNGSTVSYVQFCAGEFSTDPLTGEYPFEFLCSCVDDPSFILGKCTPLGSFTMEVSVPPAKERSVKINGEIPLPDGRTTLLEEARFGPLSVSLRFNNDNFYAFYTRARNAGFTLALKLKDGSTLDLTQKSSRLSAAEGYEWKDDSEELPRTEPPRKPVPDEATREDAPAVTTTVRERVLAASSLQSGASPAERFGVPCVLELGYGTAIDPEEVAEIEIFGKAFSLK